MIWLNKSIGPDDFFEVYVNAPITLCEQRDVKGLYQQARKGQITSFTGISAPYEAPLHPDLELKTDILSIEQAVDITIEFLLPHIRYSRGGV